MKETDLLELNKLRTPQMLDYPEIIEMLKTYDTTRVIPLKNALGYEDTRINTYSFKDFTDYLASIEKLSKIAGITITGISFISAAKPNYAKTGKSYQDLIYIPTTTIDGKQIAFDPVQSVKQGKLVTFKDMLAKNGYKWIYNTLEDFKAGQKEDCDYSAKKTEKSLMKSTDLSGAGNTAHLVPPY